MTQKIIQDQIKALEECYKEPELVQVAAGFAKPQSCAFSFCVLAPAEALGENAE